MATYIIWNSEKVGGNVTVKGLIEFSKSDRVDCSYVESNNIEGLVNSIYNETDVELCHAPYMETGVLVDMLIKAIQKLSDNEYIYDDDNRDAYTPDQIRQMLELNKL